MARMGLTERFGHMSLNQQVGLAFGLTYLLVGAIGFAFTTDLGFFARQGDEFIIFELNSFHNIVHLAIGALLSLGALAGVSQSRAANGIVGAGYMAVGIYGLVILGAGFQEANIFAINQADNGLHLISSALLLGVALRPVVRERYEDRFVMTQTGPARARELSEEVYRPGQNAPATGVYVCEGDGTEVRLDEGTQIPPCPSGAADTHRYRMRVTAES